MTVKATYAPERQCVGKKQFLTKREAKRAARRAETVLGGGRLETYRCPHCGWWHNGHRPPHAVVSPGVES